MPTVTTSELVDRAKAAADMRDNFVTPAQWEAWATQERLALDLFLARSGWSLSPNTFNIIVDGTEGGVYPVDPQNGVMAIVCVHQMNTEGTQYRLLRYQNLVNFNYNIRNANPTEYLVTWSGDNLSLKFSPTPSVGDRFLVTYIAHPLKLKISDANIAATGTITTPDSGVALSSLLVGSAGNVTTVTLTGEPAPGGVTEGEATLTTDTPSLVEVTYYDSDSTFSPLPTPTTWAQVYAALNQSTIIEVSSELSSGNIGLSGGSVVMAGGVDAVTRGLSNDVRYPMGWEERIVLGMARRALIKEESDTRSIDQEIAIWDQRIEEACWSRVLSEVPKVRNTDAVNYGWTDRYSLPPFGLWTFV